MRSTQGEGHEGGRLEGQGSTAPSEGYGEEPWKGVKAHLLSRLRPEGNGQVQGRQCVLSTKCYIFVAKNFKL